MKTRIFMDNGKVYDVDMDAKSLIENHLTDTQGNLLDAFIHFDEFSINPVHISSLEENDETKNKSIGF
ncbi:hypothetical protein JOD43_001294 [Pullulanibacillus pueri]|uniref:Uncharacterized protein n=1 Tax=Pullulanibacillus pueri TaxID=1437324 RepID=A0A8J2ZTY0_9BACL|nr:hypothetical protein [Pullulanibacillus pueri]MBM7681127.1 hypothetical protein [Pullulanibacillus pueri]GGH77149.1 hypothetical protein GCM10007096_08620 [Pullulanibacillus pueri]